MVVPLRAGVSRSRESTHAPAHRRGHREQTAVAACREFRDAFHDEDFFVVTAVEDADASTLRHAVVDAPEKVVIEFVFTRLLERVDFTAPPG